jgi:hypothetical protein
MTYIVAGRLKSKPFLMVDSIVTVNIPKEGSYSYFKNKLRRLKSTQHETYCCLIGAAPILDILTEYDDWISRKIDRRDYQSVNSLMSGFKLVLENSIKIDYLSQLECIDNRLYFISPESLVYFDITNENKKLNISQAVEIENNKYLGIHINNSKQKPVGIITDAEHLKEFCKSIILKESIGVDFKDRFSFVYFADEAIRAFPDKAFSDLVNGILKNDYEILDDKKYFWRI